MRVQVTLVESDPDPLRDSLPEGVAVMAAAAGAHAHALSRPVPRRRSTRPVDEFGLEEGRAVPDADTDSPSRSSEVVEAPWRWGGRGRTGLRWRWRGPGSAPCRLPWQPSGGAGRLQSGSAAREVAFLRGRRRRIEGDRRLMSVAGVQVGGGGRIVLSACPDLGLRSPPRRGAPAWVDRILHDQKNGGRVGNSVRITVVVPFECRAPDQSPL